MQKTKKPESQQEQSKRFIEKAKEIGADKPEDVDEVMRRLAKQRRRPQAPERS